MMVEESVYEQRDANSGRAVVAGLVMGVAVGATLAVLLTPDGSRRLRILAGKAVTLARKPAEEAEGAAVPVGAINRMYLRQVVRLTAQGVADLALAALRGVRRHFQDAVAAGEEAAREAQQDIRGRYQARVKTGARREG